MKNLKENHRIISLRYLHVYLDPECCGKGNTVTSVCRGFFANSIGHSGRSRGCRIILQRCLTDGLTVQTQNVATNLRIYDPIGMSN